MDNYNEEKKSKRALRRHHLRRMKKKAKSIYSRWSRMTEEEIENLSNKNANHLAVCSCSMCGNQRRHSKSKQKYTKQEILSKYSNLDYVE